MDMVDAEELPADQQNSTAKTSAHTDKPSDPSHPHGMSIDVCFEASKLPLDVAIFNSSRATGDEKIRKYLQAVLVIGGTALLPGMSHALESRRVSFLSAISPFCCSANARHNR